MGAVSKVTVRLQRQHESRLGHLQFLASVDRAFRSVEALRGEPSLETTAIEFLDPRSHELARESGQPAVDRVLPFASDPACSVFAEIGYEGEKELLTIAERLTALVAAAGGDPETSLAGPEDSELRAIRAFRHAVPERVKAISAQRREQHPALHKIATDMAVQDASQGWVYARYQQVLGGAGPGYAVFGHVGDNHF